MRKQFPAIIENGRILEGKFASEPGVTYGMFEVVPPMSAVTLMIIAYDCQSPDDVGGNWEHVLVSTPARCPTWKEMCFVKECFFEDSECAIQFHPAKKDYINDHPFVLHLWRCPSMEFPLPPTETV